MKFCGQCLWAKAAGEIERGEYRHDCTNPRVVACYPDVLANHRGDGDPRVRCSRERNRGLMAVCGREGRAWEPRPTAAERIKGEREI